MRKIEKVIITPLKMGRVKSTGAIRAIECNVVVEWNNGKKDHYHRNTKEKGIYEAYQFGASLVIENQKERGVA